MKDQREVCRLSPRSDVASDNSYPAHYRPAFACSLLLYPPSHRHALRHAFPDDLGDRMGKRRAYHVPPLSLCGLGRVSSPVVRQLRHGSSEPTDLTTYLLVQAIQHLALGLCDDDYNASPELTDTTPSWFPTPLMLGVASWPCGRKSPSLAERGYVVTGASHPRITPDARPGRRLRAVPQVMSLHKSA